MGFFSSISHAVSSVGKKVSGAVNTAVKVGQKVSGAVGSVAKKVSSVSNVVSKGLAVAGGVAAAVGLEPVAGALEGAAGAAKAVSLGSKEVGAVATKVHSGLDRAQKITGAVSSAFGNKQDPPVAKQTTTKKSIERGKDVRQQVAAPTTKAIVGPKPAVGAPPLNYKMAKHSVASVPHQPSAATLAKFARRRAAKGKR